MKRKLKLRKAKKPGKAVPKLVAKMPASCLKRPAAALTATEGKFVHDAISEFVTKDVKAQRTKRQFVSICYSRTRTKAVSSGIAEDRINDIASQVYKVASEQYQEL